MKLPNELKKAWDDREGPVILATVDPAGKPNAIYATCVGLHGDERIVVADNYFAKTRKNILDGSHGAILFLTKDKKAYQFKGKLEYHRNGPVFDGMKKWNPEKHPGHAAAALVVEEAYSGATQLLP